jgi:hypothetical protein
MGIFYFYSVSNSAIVRVDSIEEIRGNGLRYGTLREVSLFEERNKAIKLLAAHFTAL